MFHEADSATVRNNAAGELFFAALKTELVYVCRFKTLQDARMEILEHLEGFYNRENIGIPQD